MAEWISNVGEEVFDQGAFPMNNERICFRAEVINIVVSTLFFSVRPSLVVGDDFDGTLQRSRRIKSRVPAVTVAEVERLFHIYINVFPLWS
jgi:hypothetical protein